MHQAEMGVIRSYYAVACKKKASGLRRFSTHASVQILSNDLLNVTIHPEKKK
uniref:Uncharacterized protein n=1 Tax=Anguilla anguilla TaxID=7936 RepID=A0A0E9RAC3_ANGAN